MKQKYLILISILILAFFAGNFVYPDYLNKGIDFLNKSVNFKIPHFWTKPFRLGPDLQGGVSLIYEADLSESMDKSGDMAGLRDLIERRVNPFGVTEPVIQVQGENRLVVELAGIKDVSEAIEMIGETPYLEFLEQRTEEETKTILDKIKELEGKTLEEMQKIKDWQIAFQNPYFKPTELTGKYLKKDGTKLIFDQTSYKPTIQLQFEDEGAKLFETITERNVEKPLAIFLDGTSIIDTNGDGKIDNQDIYAPIVKEKITGGEAVISGEMSIQKANEIVRRLNSGALPVKIGEPISQRLIGPILGEIYLKESLMAGMYGFLAILLFMIIFYKMPGLFASFSLLIYIALMLSLVKIISVTLSLAGIAGFLLSMGMAVDANILIFSRLREELKQGKGYLVSLEEGIRRAWPSIRDGNFTTILVGLVLFGFGTSFVKGFALILIIGNLVGMFTAIFITNAFLRILYKEKPSKLAWFWH